MTVFGCSKYQETYLQVMNASNSKIVKLFIEQKDDEFLSSSDVV
jgi:hypothetical protein